MMEGQQQVQSLQGQVYELKEQVSELIKMIREMARNKKVVGPSYDLNIPAGALPTITGDSSAQ